MTDATYAELLRRATTALGLGESVILDASWSSDRHRQQAAAVADATAGDLVELCCAAPAAVTEQRIRRRRAGGAGPSDATPAVAAVMAGRFDPWPSSSTIDTAGPRPASLARALGASGAAVPGR